MRSQASMPNLASSQHNDLSCSRKRPSGMLGLRVGLHDRHPSIAEPGRTREDGIRRTAKPDRNRTLHGRRDNAHVLEIVKPAGGTSLSLCDQRRRSTSTCSAWRAPRVFPFRIRVLRLDVIPAQAQCRAGSRPPLRTSTSAACLAISPVCRCGAIRMPLESLILSVTAAQKSKGNESFVESILFVVQRCPPIARLRSEDVIGHFNIGVAKILRCLRPITDLGSGSPYRYE